MRPRNIVKQKSADSSTGAASVLKGDWREPLCLTLHVSTRKKASLPEEPKERTPSWQSMIRSRPSLSMWVCHWALCNPIRRFLCQLRDNDFKASCGVAEGWVHKKGRFTFFKSGVFLTANFTRLPL